MNANVTDLRGSRQVPVALVVLDGSIPGDATVRSALTLAQQSGRQLVFAYIDDELSPHALPAKSLAAAQRAATAAGIPARAIGLPAFSPGAILAASQITSAEMVMLGRGEPSSDHAPYPGALIDVIVRTAHIPVSIVA